MLDFTLPVNIGRCSLPDVEVSCEWEGKSFIQSSLVQKEGFLEGMRISRDQGRSGEHYSSAQLVANLWSS